jgi:ATP-dependent Lon protease
VLVRTAISQFEGYIKLNKKIPPEVLTSLNSIDDPRVWRIPSLRTCR